MTLGDFVFATTIGVLTLALSLTASQPAMMESIAYDEAEGLRGEMREEKIRKAKYALLEMIPAAEANKEAMSEEVANAFKKATKTIEDGMPW